MSVIHILYLLPYTLRFYFKITLLDIIAFLKFVYFVCLLRVALGANRQFISFFFSWIHMVCSGSSFFGQIPTIQTSNILLVQNKGNGYLETLAGLTLVVKIFIGLSVNIRVFNICLSSIEALIFFLVSVDTAETDHRKPCRKVSGLLCTSYLAFCPSTGSSHRQVPQISMF